MASLGRVMVSNAGNQRHNSDIAPYTDHLQIANPTDGSKSREGLKRVDSGCLVISYLESVPRSEFGATTDVRQAAGYDFWLAAVLTLSANSCPSRATSEGQLCRNFGLTHISVVPRLLANSNC